MLKQSGSKALWDLVATIEPGLATPEPNLLTKQRKTTKESNLIGLKSKNCQKL